MKKSEQIEEMAAVIEMGRMMSAPSNLIAETLVVDNGYRKVERGEWKIVGDIEKLFLCTACNSKLKLFAKFCPECGAGMRKEGEENEKRNSNNAI